MADLDNAPTRKLDSIARILGLTETELASLFSLRRASLKRWRTGGVPRSRRASVDRLYSLACLLARELKPERVAGIVRAPDAWLGDRSIIDTIRSEGPDPIYAYLGRLFASQKSSG